MFFSEAVFHFFINHILENNYEFNNNKELKEIMINMKKKMQYFLIDNQCEIQNLLEEIKLNRLMTEFQSRKEGVQKPTKIFAGII